MVSKICIDVPHLLCAILHCKWRFDRNVHTRTSSLVQRISHCWLAHRYHSNGRPVLQLQPSIAYHLDPRRVEASFWSCKGEIDSITSILNRPKVNKFGVNLQQ